MLSFKPALPANLFIGIIFLGCIYTHGGGGGLVNKSCLTLVIPWTVARQTPLSMGFSRQEYWSGLPFPSPIYLYIYKSSLEWMPTLFLSGCSSLPLPLSTKQTVPLCVIPLAVVLCL